MRFSLFCRHPRYSGYLVVTHVVKYIKNTYKHTNIHKAGRQAGSQTEREREDWIDGQISKLIVLWLDRNSN